MTDPRSGGTPAARLAAFEEFLCEELSLPRFREAQSHLAGIRNAVGAEVARLGRDVQFQFESTAGERNRLADAKADSERWERAARDEETARLALGAEVASLRAQIDEANSVDGVTADEAPLIVDAMAPADAWVEGYHAGQDSICGALAPASREPQK